MNQASSLLRRALIAQVPRRTKAYLGELKGSMNDLPQPSGSWKTSYEAKQRKYNAQLLIGVTFFLGTIGFAQATGIFFFNATVPDRPSDKLDYSSK